MTSLEQSSPPRPLQVPWFQRRAGVTIAVAIALFGGVFLLCLLAGHPGDAITMLFVLPISLLAVAFGLRAGVTSGLVGAVLVVFWIRLEDVNLSVIGWAAWILPLLLIGALLGDASDKLRRAEIQRRALEADALRHREAIEINDTLVQGMAAAKWSLESGRVQAGLDILEHTLGVGHRLVSDLMHDADIGDCRNSVPARNKFAWTKRRSTPAAAPPAGLTRRWAHRGAWPGAVWWATSDAAGDKPVGDHR